MQVEDKRIVELYMQRDATAIKETQIKYGKLCHYIAYSILGNKEDAEECENDTYNKVWNLIPPQCPIALSAFLSKITRNIAIDRYRIQSAKKRGNGQYEQVLDELTQCIPYDDNTKSITDNIVIRDGLNTFLASLPDKTRKLFMRRYWYMSSIKEIATDFSMSESNVKMTLLRTRKDLKAFLEKEGINI